MFAMIYILSIVLCFAVGVMLAYHLYGISWGETSVEGQDHEEYRRKAKERNEVRIFNQQLASYSISFQQFVNSYDLGYGPF
jgi:palmitoyltransferase